MMQAFKAEGLALDWSIYDWLKVVSAVVFGNALVVSWVAAAIKCHQLQKTGVKDDELPWWVYLGLIAAPLTVAGGAALLS